MSKPGLRDAIKAISPPWLQTGTAEKFLYTHGAVMDALCEKMNQAIHAHMPTYAPPSALPFIGADRLIPQGFLEPNANYYTRLQQAFDSWARAGSDRSVMQQVLGYLTPVAPQMRCVTDPRTSPAPAINGWNTYLAGTNLVTNPMAPITAVVAENWNWDGQFLPWRFFLIIFSVAPNVIASGEGTWGDGALWGDASASWGLSVPASEISSIRGIVATFKSQWCQWIIISFDNTLFDPGAAADGTHNPNGTWGFWGHLVAGVWVPSRPANARYCSGVA